MAAALPLSVRELTKTFRSPLLRHRVDAVCDLSFDIEAGEVLGLVGPNGSGKTTVMRCALGLLTATRGESRVFGAQAGTLEARHGLGYSPEHLALSGLRTGRQTLTLLGRLSGIARSKLRARVGGMLERMGLERAADRPIRGYSKGMVRRLGIAAALLDDPRLIVLDEPFDGLDPLGSLDVREEILRRAEGGAAILLSSHNLAELEAVATDLLILHQGRTLEQGSQSAVLTRDGVAELQIRGLDSEARRALDRSIRDAGGEIVAERPAKESLEELFRRRLRGDDS